MDVDRLQTQIWSSFLQLFLGIKCMLTRLVLVDTRLASNQTVNFMYVLPVSSA